MASPDTAKIREYHATFEKDGERNSAWIQSLDGTRDDEIRASVTRAYNLPPGTPITVLKGPLC